MRYKELLSLLESEYDVEVGGASGVLRSAHSDYGTYRVENAAMITRINAFIHNYLKEACLEPKQTVFGLRQKLNQFGLDFEFNNKNNVTEGVMDLKLTRFGGIFGKSDTTPFDQFDNEDGFEKTMGHGLTLKLETTIDESGLYKMEGKVVPTISETSEEVELDELDKSTVQNYERKAKIGYDIAKDMSKHEPHKDDRDEMKRVAKRRAMGMARASARTEEVEVEEAKANKDYDGDGKVESGTDEWKGSRDKAIKKRMASRTEDVEQVDELKKSTLMSYKDKAKKSERSGRDTGFEGETPSEREAGVRQVKKRVKGIDGATKRLVSRKYDKED